MAVSSSSAMNYYKCVVNRGDFVPYPITKDIVDCWLNLRVKLNKLLGKPNFVVGEVFEFSDNLTVNGPFIDDI